MSDNVHSLRLCPSCGHAQPSIYFTARERSLCFDCATGVQPAEDPARSERPPDADEDLPGRLTLPARDDLSTAAAQHADAFAAAVAALTPAQRRALDGYRQGQTLGQIGRNAGVGTASVSKALARAVATLRGVGVLNAA